MTQTFFSRCVAFILLSLSFSVSADKIVHYENEPFTIELIVGEERTIQFGDHVQVGITKAQQAKRLFRIQSAQGALFVLANREFDKQRVQVKRLTDGQVILFDLIATKSTTEQKPLEKVRVFLPSDNEVEDPQVPSIARDKRRVISPIDLTRHASQRLYGPSRLHTDIPGITESSLSIKSAVRVFKGANKYRTYTKPVLAYHADGHYLTALHIKNVSDESVTLDYLDLNLPFSHATFQHHGLSPNGSAGDSTILYLVAKKPLKETLYPWTYYLDAQAEAQEMARLKREQEKAEKRKRRNKHMDK